MLTRSKSVPKISNFEVLRKVPAVVQSLHERISSRLYGDRSIPFFRGVKVFRFVDNPPPMHLHTNKSFEQVTQSVPSARVKKLQEARMFNKRSSDPVRLKSSASIHNTSTHSISRLDKSTEILSQMQNFIAKEQENTEAITRRSQNFSKQISQNLKGINRKLSLIGIPTIATSNSINKMSRIRVLSNNNYNLQ